MATLPIAPAWFEHRVVGDGVTLFWEPHVHDLLRANIWHVRGRDADLLIDTGLGVAPLAGEPELLRRPLVAVATHTHMDHTGGMHEFAERAVHPLEAEAMAQGSNHLPLDIAQYDERTKQAIVAMGYDISAGLLSALPSAGFKASTHRLQPATATRLLQEGDVLDLGDRAFEVLHLPGHSPGSIGLWDATTGTLFSGDAVYDGPLLDEIPGADIPAYLTTMERLLRLPVEVVHGGHDASFGRVRLVEIATAYLRRRAPRDA